MILPLAVAAGLALIAGAAAIMAFGFGLSGMGTLGAGALPLGAALLLLVTAVATTFRKPTDEGDEEPVDRFRLSGYLLGVTAFAVAFAELGALTAVAGLFLFILKPVERLSWKATLVITVLAVAGTWLLFERLLSVPLPRGLLR